MHEVCYFIRQFVITVSFPNEISLQEAPPPRSPHLFFDPSLLPPIKCLVNDEPTNNFQSTYCKGNFPMTRSVHRLVGPFAVGLYWLGRW